MNVRSKPPAYRRLGLEALRAYLANVDPIRARLGEPPKAWVIDEVGDGNLNFVYRVHGDGGSVAVKQAVPYVRIVGDSWPLSTARAHYEQMALTIQARHAPGLVPELLHYDQTLAMLVMELLEPHIIMRQGLIRGITYPHFVDAITTFAANTLFFTSDLALPAADKKRMSAAFAGNFPMSKLIEDLVFTEPYMDHPNNRWTPPLDPVVRQLQGDCAAKAAVSRLKLQFLSAQEALIHADLHAGSIMVTEGDTRVIDAEFAFVGPMGYDLGALLGNLLISYFAQMGHEESPGSRAACRSWLLSSAEAFWEGFRGKFLRLWQIHGDGDAYPAALFVGPDGQAVLKGERERYLDRLYHDTIAFTAAEIIRRIVGLAHNIDLEWISNKLVRASIETRLLALARDLLVSPERYGSIQMVTSEAERRYAAPTP